LREELNLNDTSQEEGEIPMRQVKNKSRSATRHPLPSPVVCGALDEAITLANTLLLEFGDPPALNERQRWGLDEGIAELLTIRDTLELVLDSDGFLRNWLVDVVRQVRRGNPGAARFELDQVSKRLEALRAQWE
jgi:hypothetical protein